MHPPHSPQVVVSSFEETLPKDQYRAADYARHTAMHKALDVARLLAVEAAAAKGGGSSTSGSGVTAQQQVGQEQRLQVPTLVIGADTVVEYGEHILEKPADAEEAACVLRMLSGRRHHVHTGVALVMAPEGAAGAASGQAAADAGPEAAGEAPEMRTHAGC